MNPAIEQLSQLKNVLLTSSPEFNISNIKIVLEKLTSLMQTSQFRISLNEKHWEDICQVCSLGAQLIKKSEIKVLELEYLASVFRFLRNACAGSGDNHSFILNSPDIAEFICLPLKIFLNTEKLEEITVLKICIQLYGNLLVSNEKSKPYIFKLFFNECTFKHLLHFPDQTVQEYTMMVLYNSMSDENSAEILTSSQGHDIVRAVTDSLLINVTDWGLLFIEYLLKREEFQGCYSSLLLQNRLLVLDIMIEHLKSAENEETSFIPVATIQYFKNSFINHTKGIVQLCSVNSTLEPAECLKMLSLLCTASVCNFYLPCMHLCKDLLEKCIETLKCVHLLGKDGTNVFSSMSSSQMLSANCDEQIIASHPYFGFKKDLIKLIGNLCYDCKENQDLVRKLDGIPLVLDCCKLDAKNPFIMQWCILAIRNIVHHNQENQAVLAGITTTGEIEDSSFLKDIGIHVRYKDGKLSLS